MMRRLQILALLMLAAPIAYATTDITYPGGGAGGGSGNANYATTAGSAQTANVTSNVIAGGNVTTNQVSAAQCIAAQYLANGNYLILGTASNPNGAIVAQYVDAAFGETQYGFIVPARIGTNAANFNSGILALGGIDANHVGLMGQSPNPNAPAGFTGGTLAVRAGDGSTSNYPSVSAQAFYAPNAGPFHVQNGGTSANPPFQICNTVLAGAYTGCGGFHSPQAGYTAIDSNGTAAVTFDGSQNASFAGNVSAPSKAFSGAYYSASGGGAVFNLGSFNYGLGKQNATSISLYSGSSSVPVLTLDGTLVQFTTSGGLFTSVLLGGATDSTGIMLVPSNGSLAIVGGASGNGMQVAAGQFKSTSSLFTAQNGGTAAAPVYTGTGGGRNTGAWFPSVTSVGFSANGNNVMTLDANLLATFAGDASVAGNLILPNASGTTPSVIRLGPATSAGVQIFRNGNGVLQFGLADSSGNAVTYAAKWGTSNDLGASAPQFFASYKTNYGLYIQNSPASTNIVTAGVAALSIDASQNGTWSGGTVAGARTSTVSKTANYTLTTADNGVHFDNTGATGAITLTLLTPTGGQNGCVTVTAAQSVAVTTPTGAILGPSFTSGATRTTSAQLTTWCWEAHGANYYIVSANGPIAS